MAKTDPNELRPYLPSRNFSDYYILEIGKFEKLDLMEPLDKLYPIPELLEKDAELYDRYCNKASGITNLLKTRNKYLLVLNRWGEHYAHIDKWRRRLEAFGIVATYNPRSVFDEVAEGVEKDNRLLFGNVESKCLDGVSITDVAKLPMLFFLIEMGYANSFIYKELIFTHKVKKPMEVAMKVVDHVNSYTEMFGSTDLSNLFTVSNVEKMFESEKANVPRLSHVNISDLADLIKDASACDEGVEVVGVQTGHTLKRKRRHTGEGRKPRTKKEAIKTLEQVTDVRSKEFVEQIREQAEKAEAELIEASAANSHSPAEAYQVYAANRLISILRNSLDSMPAPESWRDVKIMDEIISKHLGLNGGARGAASAGGANPVNAGRLSVDINVLTSPAAKLQGTSADGKNYIDVVDVQSSLSDAKDILEKGGSLKRRKTKKGAGV